MSSGNGESGLVFDENGEVPFEPGDPQPIKSVADLWREKHGLPPDTRTAEEKQADAEKFEKERKERDREYWQKQRQNEKRRRLDLLSKEVGAKYLNKKLRDREYYGTEAEQAKQRSIFGVVETFIQNMKENVASGKNLILVGARGTGKDYCFANCMGASIWRHDLCPVWVNGSQLFSDLQEGMINKDALRSYPQIIYRYQTCDIVAISDPVPASGNLTEFQATSLLNIMDYRYRHDLPTWVTLNVASRVEAEERIGAMLIDRLFENAEVIFFDWTSHREWVRNKK